MESDTLKELRREFDRGLNAAMDPDNQESIRGGPAITNLRCWWLATPCDKCHHTFRPGDRVMVSITGSGPVVHHASAELPCSGTAEQEVLDPAMAAEFFRGLHDAWPLPQDQPVVLLTADHPLTADADGGFERCTCFMCGHTFRPMDQVIICPCRPGTGTCQFAVHCDPEHDRNCWNDWEAAGRRRFCPGIGAERP